MSAWYNEIDPQKAAWLRELIRQGHIADGVVDETPIERIRPVDIASFTQCHFFAGIGVWSHALRVAGWSDDTPVWTGSCPCQGFSAGGKREGFSDERHLWPAWFRLIRELRPQRIFGEQVASNDGLAWFDIVSSDMEGEGYAIGACDTCAAGFGAPHIRQRLYFVAHAGEFNGRIAGQTTRGRRLQEPGFNSISGLVADSANARCDDTRQHGSRSSLLPARSEQFSVTGLLGHSSGARLEGRQSERGHDGAECQATERTGGASGMRPGPVHGFWRDADWLLCTDGKWRPVRPGSFPLAHGSPARVGRLRGYGDGIVAPQAAAFIRAYREISRGD